MATDHTLAVFLAELILLLFVGRLLGEAMSRLGQPAIFGQLLAGIILGPSVFGALLPDLRPIVFPDTPALKSMIDAVSQIGILLLLLLTGMETNLSLVSRRRRAVISSSLLGIAVPFGLGVLFAYLLPASVVPSPEARLVTALFIGTALSISSVKIVAMVLMEVGAIRRDLGQLILATAILDDTVAWVIIAVIAGIAAHGTVSLGNIGTSLAGTAIFLGVSLTVGRRLVARLIVWINDNMTIDVPVITAILLVMLAMALTTDLIGVHTALGAFVAGILVGQSPILTEHIEGELRGFIIAFFSPVFFAVAGLGMDLRTLLDPTLLVLTLAIIAVASIGKFMGALSGGLLGGLTMRESLAMGTGLNARGSTEVIIASIGLAMGALNHQLYTMIVAMAVATTMAMPPMLRWMMVRVPLREAESRRLDKEEAEAGQDVPKMERALVLVDDSPNGRLASRLAGLFAVRQQVLTTILERPGAAVPAGAARPSGPLLALAAKAETKKLATADVAAPPAAPPLALEQLIQVKGVLEGDAVEREVGKGYSIAFVGIEIPIQHAERRFEEQIQRLVESFDGPIAIVVNAGRTTIHPHAPLDILVPTGGTQEGRLATELALILAKATEGTLAALHVFDPQEDTDLLRGRARRMGMSVLVDAHRLGKRSGVSVKGLTATNANPDLEIRRATRRHHYDLVVMGASLRRADVKFVGPRTASLLRDVRTPILLIAR